MRNTFIVFGKLLGLLVFYWTLVLFVTTAQAFWLRLDSLHGLFSGARWFQGVLAHFLLTLILALLLMFKTERVADWLRLKKDDAVAKAPSIHAILAVGSALIGIYVLVYAVPSLVANLLEIKRYPDHWDKAEFVRTLVARGLEMILAFVLVFRAEAVATFLEKRRWPREHLPPPEGTEHPVSHGH